MTTPHAPFNAWSDAWLPVTDTDGTQRTVSLRTAFAQADQIRGLGSGLTPLDRDSLHRLLPALGAAIISFAAPATLDAHTSAGTFPVAALDAFESAHLDRFALVGDRPFMQRWDHPQSDLDDLNAKQATQVRPLTQLHPHAPGGSSSKWGVRRDSRATFDWPTVTLLLVTTWFQTRNGNGQDPWGASLTSGSSGSWRPRALAVHLIADTLGKTTYANMPESWLERSELPAFLAHDSMPGDVAAAEVDSLWRVTYAKTLPLLRIDVATGAPAGFVLGPDATVPVPPLHADEKEALKTVHHGDHTRLRHDVTKKDGRVEREYIGSTGAPLGTVEGATQWFLREGRIKKALVGHRALERAGGPYRTADWDAMRLGVYNETADTKGMTRTWADWSEIDTRAAGYDPAATLAVETLLTYVDACRRALAYACRLATGDSKPPMLDRTQADLLSAVTPLLASSVETASQAPDPDASPDDPGAASADVATVLEAARRTASTSFRAAVAPLTTPINVERVANATGWFDHRIAVLLSDISPATAAPDQAASPTDPADSDKDAR